MSAPITDELSTTESPVIDHPIEEPQAESATNENVPDGPEILSQTVILATDETASPTQDSQVNEPSESAPVALEMQSFEETEIETPETHVLNGNGHSTATQETIGTHGMFLNSYIPFMIISLTVLEGSSGLFSLPQNS